MMLNTTLNLVSPLSITRSNNTYCSERLSTLQCHFIRFTHNLVYILLAISLLPQIIHLFKYRTRYIAGVSYIWIIIRVLGLTSLMIAHAWKWPSALECIAMIITIIIFCQILIFPKNLHRQNKIILIATSLSIWIIGGCILFFVVKRENLLLTIGYLLLAMQLLPQILLNSFLRTANALSNLSILLLLITDLFTYVNISTKRNSSIHLISIFYSFSFGLFAYLQSIMYTDAHIHIISRSEHTVLSSGVDIFTGLDSCGTRSTGEDPQMFSIDDIESVDGSDIIYQPVTTNKASKQTSAKDFIWYAVLACFVCMEIACAIVLMYHIRSLWIILVPLSIPAILGIFYLLRTKLSVLATERLRKVL